jgi:glucose 1-dehydrogenase
MKAYAIWPDRKQTALIEQEEPRLASPTGVLVRVLEVGVCGTDAEICSFLTGDVPDGSEYLIPGHEAIGQVEEVGPEVSNLRPGDLVVPSVRRPCRRAGCAACRAGAQDYCETGEYTERGIRGAHGFLTERFVEEERYLYCVPPELREVGVLTEPLTIAEKALRQYLAVQRRLPWTQGLEDAELLAGRRAVVLGAGPIAILGCMLLLQRGCRVWVYSRGRPPDPKIALIESIGGRYASSQEVSFAELAEEIGGPDFVYEAAGAASLAFEVMRHLARNAVLVLTGVPEREGRLDVAANAIMHRLVLANQVVLGTVNASAADFTDAIRDLGEFIRQWPDALPRVITGRHALADFCGCVLERGGIKQVVVVGDGA